MAALVACLGLAACGDDDESADETPAGEGTLTIDGANYSFSPVVCLPDDPNSAISGPGTAADGSPIFVDMAGGNLSIYLGVDDPFADDSTYEANNFMEEDSMIETVSGTTISVEAKLAEADSLVPTIPASLSVTC